MLKYMANKLDGHIKYDYITMNLLHVPLASFQLMDSIAMMILFFVIFVQFISHLYLILVDESYLEFKISWIIYNLITTIIKSMSWCFSYQ